MSRRTGAAPQGAEQRHRYYSHPEELTDEEREEQQIYRDSVIHDFDEGFEPRTLKLNGKPFKVELGPRLFRYLDGTDSGCNVYPWADTRTMVRLNLIGERRMLNIMLGFNPTGFPFPTSITFDKTRWVGRIRFDDGQTQEIRDFESDVISSEDLTLIERARTRRLRAECDPALPSDGGMEDMPEAPDNGAVPAASQPMPERPDWGICDEGATFKIYTPEGEFTVKNNVGYRQIVWMFCHAAGGKTYDISQLYSETQGRAEHTAALPEFLDEDSGGEEHEPCDAPASGTVNVDAQTDVKTKEQVRKQLRELAHDREQAIMESNETAIAEIDKETADLTKYLSATCGLNGKPRGFGNDLSRRIATVKKR